jgi:hypothetical protein
LVIEDTNSILLLLNRPFATSINADSELIKIFLRRSLRHIATIALRFFATHGESIETSIWKVPFLNPVTKGIVQHIVLSATDVVRRDALMLINSMSPVQSNQRANQVKLGITICRMHWWPTHLKKVREEFKKNVGVDLRAKIATMHAQDSFREVMAALLTESEG